QQLQKADDRVRTRDFANGNLEMDFAPGGIGGGRGGGPPARALMPFRAPAPMADLPKAPSGPPPDRQPEGVKERLGDGKDSGAPGQGAAPITKVREYFPETMLWMPNLITDDKGVADLAVDFADSITTWRLSASANSAGGLLGNANVPLKVFQ